jgi:outer membrane receptor protein involved in Fe transport
MRKIYLLTLLFSVVSLFSLAQSGEISGKITDEKGEGIPFANVAIVENGQPTGIGATTNFDGFYSIKPLNPGRYDVKFSYMGYTSIIKTDVVVRNDQSTYIDQKMSPSEQLIEEIQIIEYRIPLIDPGETSSKNTITAEDIADLPSRSIQNLASTTAGVTQGDKDGGINVRGGRGDAIIYYVDGVRTTQAPNLPISSLEQMDIITGGVPARYGDATSGVINITTKGGAKKFAGGVEVQSSLDRWRFDLVNANFTGPMLKNSDGATVIGYSMNAEFQRQLDPRPSSVDMYKVKDDKFDELEREPLFLDEAGNVRLKAESLTWDDLEVNRIKRNTVDNQVRFNGRLDFRLNDKMNLAVGGNFNYNRYHLWVEEYSLLNFENNPLYNEMNYKMFARFTHNIGKKFDEESTRQSPFQNAFYQVQFDYEKFKRTYEDDDHRDDLFAYGYIGQFDTRRAPVFLPSEDNEYYELVNFSDTAVYFTPGAANEKGSAYTSQLFDLIGETDADGNRYYRGGVLDIQATPGLINGERAELPYSIWFNTGRQYNGFAVDNDDDKYRLQVNGGFDFLKPGAETRNKHSITFGLEYEQRVLRHYSLNPLGLWDLARLQTNNHLIFDRENPFFYNNGQLTPVDPNNPDIYLGDTIFYQYTANPETRQSYFDRNLREKLGAEDNEWLNVYNLPLSTFSIDMFSADELLENRNVADYRGYDVYGNRTSGAVSFQDFWNKVDENGNKTRPIAPFRPVYAAGYIEDKFQLKDLTFRLGLRVDRWDANQYVMKDPYSIYGSVTAGELGRTDIPDNIGSNYVVYAESADGPIFGYRNGDQFFNSEGVEVANYNSLGFGGTPLTPDGQVRDIRDADFDPDIAFEKYKAQYVVMPRLQFSFNITDNALFFAHYDVLSQTPQSRIAGGFALNRSIGSPLDYYFFDRIGGAPINNPNLRPEITIDFQLGFKQKITNSSAITFSAYFKEYKNQIQVRRYDGVAGALGGVYYSYDNIDFGNTKGFEFGYDLRRTKNVRMTANYTLQFAEGTGSDDRTQLQVITATGGTNFRTVAPLNFDSRHLLNLSVDYRFASGKAYNGPVSKNGKQMLSDFGVNLLTQARSGRPYTKIAEPISERVQGANRTITSGYLNGARIGWNFRVDMKVSKGFAVEVGKEKEGKDPKKLFFDTYLWIDNLLGTANILNVYRYTGAPGEDGWLGSPQGVNAAESAVIPESYRTLYEASVNTPRNFSLPRRIYLGVAINF